MEIISYTDLPLFYPPSLPGYVYFIISEDNIIKSSLINRLTFCNAKHITIMNKFYNRYNDNDIILTIHRQLQHRPIIPHCIIIEDIDENYLSVGYSNIVKFSEELFISVIHTLSGTMRMPPIEIRVSTDYVFFFCEDDLSILEALYTVWFENYRLYSYETIKYLLSNYCLSVNDCIVLNIHSGQLYRFRVPNSPSAHPC